MKTGHLELTPVTPARARRRSVAGPAALLLALLTMAIALVAGGPARATDPLDKSVARIKPVICSDQTYGLCAGASCFVFNDVAYCRCDVKEGNSISSPFPYGDGNDICSLKREGAGNGYMASTFSLPDSLRAPYGKQALYVCPRTSRAAYAKCDGAVCFTSTSGRTFPGSTTPLREDQIVCSCPVEKANPLQGLEIIGPYPCQREFFQNCESRVANGETGSTLYDGTAIGSTVIGTRLLTGSSPRLNVCR